MATWSISQTNTAAACGLLCMGSKGRKRSGTWAADDEGGRSVLLAKKDSSDRSSDMLYAAMARASVFVKRWGYRGEGVSVQRRGREFLKCSCRTTHHFGTIRTH